MTKLAMHSRKIALEEIFFHHQDHELLAHLKEEQNEIKAIQLLAEATGINDKNVLKHAVKIGIRPETLAAISLIPLIQVAWADKIAGSKEKGLILNAAEASGIKKETPAYLLLESWLEHEPDSLLYETWSEYIHLLRSKMGKAQMENLRAEVLGRAMDVAESSGGILGIGNVSIAEKEIIRKLHNVFEGP